MPSDPAQLASKMPTSTSQQNNYYASHHRRGSQLSLASTGDLNEATRPLQSPNRSLVYLPASTYSQPTYSRDRSLSAATSPPAQNASLKLPQLDGPSSLNKQSPDPRVWGQSRQYPFPEPSETPQNGMPLQKVRSNGQASGISPSRQWPIDASRSTPALNTTIKARSASIKELVAKFDSPTDDTPPVPSRPGSRVTSRATSPTLAYAPRRPSRASNEGVVTNDQYSTWSGRRAKTPSGTRTSTSQPGEPLQSIPPTPTSDRPHPIVNTQDFDPYRRPLFGEILPQASTFLGSPGFGISSPRRRRGSEGSPMHSPNPMFPPSADSEIASPISPTAWYRDASVDNGLHSSAFTSHRRAQSDMTEASASRSLPQSAASQPSTRPQRAFAPSSAPVSGTRGITPSRIPVHRSQHSTSSSSTLSPSSSRAPSTQDRYPTSRGASQNVPKVIVPNTAKGSTPKRKPITPTQVQSPSRRAQSAIPQGEKSPSLRANIIIPPPKISPPLRSSRPRQPVSAASTAASRAKMAEKFEKAQRKNSADRNTSFRNQPKPKELSNIDLESRRKNITQALDRMSRTEIPTDKNGWETATFGFSKGIARELNSTDVLPVLPVPAVVVDKPQREDGPPYYDDESTPEAGIMPGGFPADSPDHTEGESQGLRIDPNAQPPYLDQRIPDSATSYLQPSALDTGESEPNSAVTAGTDATMIDTEPQAPFTRPRSPQRTILSQIMGLRQPSPLTPSSASCSESEGDVSDHADEESVEIMLRNTQYLEDSPALHHAHGDHLARNDLGDSPSMQSNGRQSWTSSIPDDDFEDDRLEAIQEASPDPQRHGHNIETPLAPDFRRPASAIRRRDVEPLDSLRSTMASDAYTVVDFVLQQHSNSGVVRSEVVDDVAQRVLQQSPRHMYQQTFDRDRVEELTLQQLSDARYNPDEEPAVDDPAHHEEKVHEQHDSQQSTPDHFGNSFTIYSEDTQYDLIQRHSTEEVHSHPTKPMHQYVSSRGSEDDWVTPYPASGEQSRDIEFSGPVEPTEPLTARESNFPLSKSYTEPDNRRDDDSDSTQGLGLSMRVTSPVSLPWDGYMIPRAPSHSPPPLPAIQSFDDVATRFAQSSPITLTPKNPPPQIPSRITSQSQMNQHRSRAPSTAPSFSSATIGESRQSSEQQNLSDEEKKTAEAQKRLKQRRHIIKELVDTEMTFERDMKVVVDIYQATAEPIASKADLATIFANSEEVVQFSRNFGTQLKNTAKPVYEKSRTGRSSSAQPSLTRSSSYASTMDGDRELSEPDKDRQTRVGEVFLASAAEMESVYKEYMMKQDAANKKAQTVLQTEKGKLWTSMCHNESRDLTSAWDLPSLLVKPVQRAMKYKLFLDDLLKSTPADHPDYSALKRAGEVVEGMMLRINEAKKHTELIEQAMGRKRKDSGASKGFTLTKINRGTEKLKQNMGLAEAYDDTEYTKIFREYDERLVYFMTVIIPDQEKYQTSLTAWIDKLCRIAEAGDSWVDVHPTKHMEMESKLRHFSQAARSIRRIGIEPHLAQVDKEVFEPIRVAFKMLMDFKQDPKGLLMRREKKLLDYARFRNERDRTGKLDKRSAEKVEQWEALNREAKARMTKLVKLSWEITVTCYRRFAPLHVPWFEMVTRNLAEAMSIVADDLNVPELERDFKADHEHIVTAALNLSVCNGSLAQEVSNMVSTSGMSGSDSPRQPSTWSSTNKRSTSINSEGSHDHYKRNSGNFYPSPLIQTGSDVNLPFGSSRIRASSAASGQPRTPNFGSNMMSPQSANSPLLRPGTSPGPSSADLPAFAPRVSLDAPSPFIDLESPITRPGSGSTFFSATGAPSHQLPIPTPNGGAGGSSIFSSAMPMADSPVSTRGPSLEQDHQYEHHNADSPVLFTVASIYEFNIDRARSEAGWPYLTYTSGEIFDVIGEKGELWLSRNQDQPEILGWIWNKHFMKLAA